MVFFYSSVSYQALYSYTPQNDDELELRDGDIVDVMEKCDDGWFVGECDACQAAGPFEMQMSIYAEHLEAAFICRIETEWKKATFLMISHLLLLRTLKLGCRVVELCFPFYMSRFSISFFLLISVFPSSS